MRLLTAAQTQEETVFVANVQFHRSEIGRAVSVCLSDSHGTVSHAVKMKLIYSQCILTVTQTFSLDKLSKYEAHKFRIVSGI